MERWLPVVGYEELYEVSDGSRVRSVRDRSRMMTITYRDHGYADVGLNRHGKQVNRKVHRLMLEAFVGPCPPGMVTRHLNGNPRDNRLENLCWGTYSENTYDTIRHGTHCKTRRTTCPRGHPLEAPNLQPDQLARGKRQCRCCSIARSRIRESGSPLLGPEADRVLGLLMTGWEPESPSSKTECPRGHLLIAPNLVEDDLRRGKRKCVACTRALKSARYRKRKSGLTMDVQALSDIRYAKIMSLA